MLSHTKVVRCTLHRCHEGKLHIRHEFRHGTHIGRVDVLAESKDGSITVQSHQRWHLHGLFKCVVLIHIDRLNGLTTGENDRMVLVHCLRLTDKEVTWETHLSKDFNVSRPL